MPITYNPLVYEGKDIFVSLLKFRFKIGTLRNVIVRVRRCHLKALVPHAVGTLPYKRIAIVQAILDVIMFTVRSLVFLF